MKIQYCSDLHLEFKENRIFMSNNPLIPVGEILLLAGDIISFEHLSESDDFIDYVSANFKYVYLIPGNHEYYEYDMDKVRLPIKLRHNVFLVDNYRIKIGDINFIFSTLWSRIGERYAMDIQQTVKDFHYIQKNGIDLTIQDFNNMHSKSMEFMRKALLSLKGLRTVVVTHHVPTFFNWPEEHKTSIIQEAFGTELYDFVFDSAVNYWIYGHHHSNVNDFKINDTKMLTNQLGYINNGGGKSFRRDAFFEI